jgi:phthiocerol/phenolphthiocerol synthesis type-I polyketide synthase E
LTAPTDRTNQHGLHGELLLLSAETTEALSRARRDLAKQLQREPSSGLPDMTPTVAGNRRLCRTRYVLLAHDPAEASRALLEPEGALVYEGEVIDRGDTKEFQTTFVFPGQGTQYPGMGRDLYESTPEFRRQFDMCSEAFSDALGHDLRRVVFQSGGEELLATDVAQPALFAIEYSMARTLEHCGVSATALAGHSLGEYVAATLAGVFELEDAARLVTARGRLMERSEPGAMVSVAMPETKAIDLLQPGVTVAAVNEGRKCVIAGRTADVDELVERAAALGVVTRRLHTRHAFHSELMDDIVPEFLAIVAGVSLHEPRVPLVSNVTGGWMTQSEAGTPERWANQIRSTVRFADNAEAVLAKPGVVIEVGPGRTLSSSIRRHPSWSKSHRLVQTMRHPHETHHDGDVFLFALGRIWAAGLPVDWTAARDHGG